MEEKVVKEIVNVLKREGAKRVEIFGSYARGESKKGSDIDIIVEFKGKKSLIDLIRIEENIKKRVGRKIDLLTKNSISPLIKEKIKKEVRVVYG